jgi:hypothetical protein
MSSLPTLADRAWFALHCLPRDAKGEPPAARELERAHGLSVSTLSHTFIGRRRYHQPITFAKVAEALNTTEAFLRGDAGAKAPGPLTGMLPPRPGQPWIRYGDVPGWREAVALAQLDTKIPIPAVCYLAGADYPVLRPVERMTPELARAAALLAYESSTEDEQERYSMLESRLASTGHASGKMRAAHLRRQVVK